MLTTILSCSLVGCVGWAGLYQGPTAETWSAASGINLTHENKPSSYDVDVDITELSNDRLQLRLRSQDYLCELRGRKQGNSFTLEPNQTCSGRNTGSSYSYTFMGGTGQRSSPQRQDYVGTQSTTSCRGDRCRTSTRDVHRTTTTAWVNLSFQVRVVGHFRLPPRSRRKTTQQRSGTSLLAIASEISAGFDDSRRFAVSIALDGPPAPSSNALLARLASLRSA
jgi:hypothetical protein